MSQSDSDGPGPRRPTAPPGAMRTGGELGDGGPPASDWRTGRGPVRGRSGTFFALAYAFSWLILLPAAAGAQGLLPLAMPTALLLLGGFGPALAAVVLTVGDHGWAGVRHLLGRLLLWRFGLVWYAVLLLTPPAFLLVGVATHIVLGGAPPDLANPPLRRRLGPEAAAIGPWVFLVLVFVQQAVVLFGEEVGWRGYALPALQARFSALSASLSLGILWGLWHLPLVATPAARSGVAEIPLPLFLADIVATSVFYAWIYNHTRGSLLAVTLLHAINNTAAVFLPVLAMAAADVRPFLAVVVARWLVALGLVLADGAQRLTRQAPEQVLYFDRVVRASSHGR